MKISLITMDHPGRRIDGVPYVHDTLQSLLGEEDALKHECLTPLHVFVTGTDPSFLGSWQEDLRVSVHTQTQGDAEQLLRMEPYCRMAQVTGRALAPFDDSVLLLEDDLLFARDWMKRTGEALSLIEQWATLDYAVLALYSPYPLAADSGEHPVVRYTQPFYGQQALYLGKEVRRKLVPLLQAESETAGDVIMHRLFTSDPSISVYALRHSVVQHVGKNSLAKAGWFHQSPTFQP